MLRYLFSSFKKLLDIRLIGSSGLVMGKQIRQKF